MKPCTQSLLVATLLGVCCAHAAAQQTSDVRFREYETLPAPNGYSQDSYYQGDQSYPSNYGVPADGPLLIDPYSIEQQAYQQPWGPWSWMLLPDGILYKSYLAGVHEPRMGTTFFYEPDQGWLWDITLGGRVGLLGYRPMDGSPDGFQIDFEGAALPRLDLEEERDLVSVDFRAGLPITFRSGPWQYKTGYYHLSSHLGDEFMDKNPGVPRSNYSRDVIIFGIGVFPTPSLRVYGEAGWAFYTSGGAKPWEFQFGAEYATPFPTGTRGKPYAAVNVQLHEEIDYSGYLNAQLGWMWRRKPNGQTLRVGFQYFNGHSPQYQFQATSEEQFGVGLWYDF